LNLEPPKYSIIILVEDCYPDFPSFVKSLNGLFSSRGEPYEILIVANGTGHFVRQHIDALSTINNGINIIEFPTRTSQAICARAGLSETTGEIIVTCGSYQQISNISLGRLIDSLDDETDILSPWRKRRVDPFFNQIQSRVFNQIVRIIVGTRLHDLTCTVKVFRREVLEETQLYGNMYRFLPVVAEQKGFKTKEVECEHLEERGKTGFYSISEYVGRILDIFTLYFNTRFTRKPLRFFSAIGLSFILTGLITMAYLFVERFFFDLPIGNRPFLMLAIIAVIVGAQVASVGLLGEIITFTHVRQKKEYTIEKII